MSGSAAPQTDDFFDHVLDGIWSGTVTIDTVPLPMQLNLNLDPGGDLAFLVLPADGSAQAEATETLAATVVSSSVMDITLTADLGDPVARRGALSTFQLAYDAATDTLSGNLSGDAKGTVALERGDPATPLQRLWQATVKIDGQNTFALLQLTEAEAATGRFAATAVGGNALIGGDSGPIVGERNGSKVNFTAQLGGGDLAFNLKLTKKNNQLSGQIGRIGQARRGGTKFRPSGGDGKAKALKAKKATPKTIDAGTSASIKLKGAGFGSGSIVHSDNGDVDVTSVTADSSKQLTIGVTAAASASGNVSLRVVSSDGQVAEKKNALSVQPGDGGGGGTTISFAASVQPIFDTNCALAGCHATGSGAGGLVLSAGSAFGNTVGVPSSEQPSVMRIKAGDAEMSYLVRKIRGDSGISGGRMPLNRTPLADSDINTIINWINEGANNNRLPR